MAITHSKVSAKTDSADTTKVLPSDWNAEHSTPSIVLTTTDPLTLTGDALVQFELRPDVDFETVRANGKPTWVTRGVEGGFSFPVYAADNEELYINIHIPYRWDGASDIAIHAHCYLASANTDKNFQMQLEWEHYTVGDVVPATDNDVSVETDTGTAAQYKSFGVEFTIDYDIDGAADPIVAGDELAMRLRRIDASANEITGEVVVTHIGIIFTSDKLGVAAT